MITVLEGKKSRVRRLESVGWDEKVVISYRVKKPSLINT